MLGLDEVFFVPRDILGYNLTLENMTCEVSLPIFERVTHKSETKNKTFGGDLWIKEVFFIFWRPLRDVFFVWSQFSHV